MDEEQLIRIAKACHEVKRVYRQVTGDQVLPPWEECTPKQRKPMLDKVNLYDRKSGLSPEEVHNDWMQEKLQNGWTYGPEKDDEEKTHPDILPYEDLPENRKFEDAFFMAVFRSLTT